MLHNWKSSSTLALTSLLAVTVIWGATFLIVQDAVSRMPVMNFLAIRFALAALVMLALRPACLRNLTKRGLWHGFLLGIVLGLGYIAQTVGLTSASASVSGFITGMFVPLTPVMAWLILRHKTNRSTWLAVSLATVGLALIGLRGWSIGIGELLTLGCAICFAIHIVGLGEWSPQHETYGLVLIQVSTVAAISLIAAAPGGIAVPLDGGVWVAVGITAVLATAVAFLVQTWAQALVSPTRAAVVMTMEPVFAGIFGVVIGGNRLTVQAIVGAICIMAAMFMVQLKSNPGPQGQKI